MTTIDNFNFSGKRALIRVDFNVPLNDQFEVTDDTRIRAALPSIQKVINDGGSVVLMSHLGRPKSGPEEKFSLKHIVNRVSDLLGSPVLFSPSSVGAEAEKACSELQSGQVILLENLRFHKEETAGEEAFARQLANLGDIYVNDAFGTAHRAHASTTVVAQFFSEKKAFGYLMARELVSADKVLHEAERPMVAIIGGAKVSSKLSVITRLMSSIDVMIIGGGMAFTFIKAMGGNVGNSLVEDDLMDDAMKIIMQAQEAGITLLLPGDAIIANDFSESADKQECPISEIPEGWMGLDIGPNSIITFRSAIIQAKTILWNGPMGVFEMESFRKGTKEVANAVIEATTKGAYSLVGGGDSVAAINMLDAADKVSYVSTGGGAMLEYMEGKVLPGVQAIQEG